MPWYPGRGRRVNDRFHGFPGAVRSVTQLEGLPTSADVEADKANKEHWRLEAGEDFRQSRKHMLRVIEASRKVLASGDKRRRPRGVTKEEFKEVRKLKLTRTAKIKKKHARV